MLGAIFKSYGGVLFPADRFAVTLDGGDKRELQVSASTVLVERGARAPAYASQRRRERRLLLAVRVIDSANAAVLTAELLRAFDAARNALAPLLVADAVGREWTLAAKVSEHLFAAGEHRITLLAPDGIWTAEAESSETWNPTGSPSSRLVTAGGTHPARPVFTVTPAALRSGGFTYRRFVTIYNGTERAFPNYPLELTGGLDTAALVSSGKLQADVDDLRVVVDGKQAPRWLANMNASNTKVWINLDLSPRIELALAAALSTGALSELEFTAGSETRRALRKLPAAGCLLIDSELFTYTSVDAENYTVGGVTRAAKWSSAASHSAGATVRWIEHDIRLAYGNASIAAPVQGSAEQPMFELDDSTNTAWVYEKFMQGLDPQNPVYHRTGSWVAGVLESTGGESGVYTGNRGAHAHQATEMGLHAAVWTQGNRPRAERYVLEWGLQHPAGVSSVAMDGEKYRSSSQWAVKSLLQMSENGRLWADSALTVATPGSASAWTAWSFSGALGATYRSLRFLLSGNLAGIAGREIFIEIKNTTLTLDSSAVPKVSLGAEQASTYELDFRIRSATTGEWFALNFPIKFGQAVRLDCETKTATSLEDNADIFRALDVPVQNEWLTFEPGANTLIFTEAGAADVDIAIAWRERLGGI